MADEIDPDVTEMLERRYKELEAEEREQEKELEAVKPAETLEREQLQDLIDKAAGGDGFAIRKLRKITGGRFENKAMEDIPPAFRTTKYPAPGKLFKQSIDELRAKREYSVEVVDHFVGRVCDPEWLPPGAAMMLFCVMCTKYRSAFQMFGGTTRMKMMQLYAFWDEAHPWVKANILFRMRDHLYENHHRTFCRAFAATARRYDAEVVPAEEAAQEVTDETTGEENEPGGVRQDLG